MGGDLYATDFYTWTQEQAAHLRSGQVSRADLANIAEEIETLGRSEASALRSAYRLIATHLLKTMFQPEKATVGWAVTIGRERLNIEQILDENPGLKPRRVELFIKAYGAARREAALETGLPPGRFPKSPPFTAEQVESDGFLPDSAGL